MVWAVSTTEEAHCVPVCLHSGMEGCFVSKNIIMVAFTKKNPKQNKKPKKLVLASFHFHLKNIKIHPWLFKGDTICVSKICLQNILLSFIWVFFLHLTQEDE